MAPSVKMFLAPALIMGLKAMKVDFAAPENLLVIRGVYGVSVVAVFLAYLAIAYKLSTTGDRQKKLKVKEKNVSGQEIETVLTYAAYDQKELQKLAIQFLMGVGMTVFIHYKWNVVPALILQAVMGPVNLTDHALAKIYLFGKKETKRPFKDESNPLAAMFKPPETAAEEVEGSPEADTTTPAVEASAAPKSSSKDSKIPQKDSKVLRLDTDTRKRK